MSLLIVNYEYPPIGGGAANAASFIAKSLAKKGNEVVVLTSRYKVLQGYAYENGVHVYRLPTLRRFPDHSNLFEMANFLMSSLLSTAKIAQRHGVQKALVFFTVPCGPIGYYLKKKFNIPYVISLRGGDVPGLVPELNPIHKFITRFRRAILRSALKIVANAEGLAELSRQHDPFPVCVIPNGVDVEFFRPKDGPKAGGDFVFLFVGRFQRQKNLFFLLDRLKELKQKSGRPFHLQLVGDGPQKADLQNYLKRLGLSDIVVWHGWVDKERLRSLYQAADCLINPSLYEGMPNTVLEAMACGLPVVASHVPGNAELVKEGETGLLFYLDRPQELTLALLKVLNNPQEAHAMGKAGREWVARDFSWDRVAEKYLHSFLLEE